MSKEIVESPLESIWTWSLEEALGSSCLSRALGPYGSTGHFLPQLFFGILCFDFSHEASELSPDASWKGFWQLMIPASSTRVHPTAQSTYSRISYGALSAAAPQEVEEDWSKVRVTIQTHNHLRFCPAELMLKTGLISAGNSYIKELDYQHKVIR